MIEFMGGIVEGHVANQCNVELEKKSNERASSQITIICCFMFHIVQ